MVLVDHCSDLQEALLGSWITSKREFGIFAALQIFVLRHG